MLHSGGEGLHAPHFWNHAICRVQQLWKQDLKQHNTFLAQKESGDAFWRRVYMCSTISPPPPASPPPSLSSLSHPFIPPRSALAYLSFPVQQLLSFHFLRSRMSIVVRPGTCIEGSKTKAFHALTAAFNKLFKQSTDTLPKSQQD